MKLQTYLLTVILPIPKIKITILSIKKIIYFWKISNSRIRSCQAHILTIQGFLNAKSRKVLGRYFFKIYIFLMKFLFLGISRLRGVVMYELQSTLSTYAKRKYSSGEISVEHLKNILKVRKKNTPQSH